MSKVMFIYVAANPNGQRNLQFGLDTLTWGFRNDEPQYGDPIDLVLFGYGHDEGGPRAKGGLETWETGRVDVILSEMTVPFYLGHGPHWPDELEADEIKYPFRFGHLPLGLATDVPASSSGPFGIAGTRALHLSGIRQGRGMVVDVDEASLLALVGVTPIEGVPNLSSSIAVESPNSEVHESTTTGAAHSSDPQHRKVVEEYAVEMAIAHMKSLGWDDIKTLGKPFDLVCRKSEANVEKHVEVKGTTGAGGAVEYTSNEVRHFRTCPHGADLIVVRDIVLDKSIANYLASGGSLNHFPSYKAPTEDLQPTRYQARVPYAH